MKAFQSPTGICECVNREFCPSAMGGVTMFQSPTGICECVNHHSRSRYSRATGSDVSVPYGDL